MKYSKSQLILAGYIALLLLSLLIAVCSEGPTPVAHAAPNSGTVHSSANVPPGLPNLAEAFPDIPRGMTMNMMGVDQQVLLTDKGFSSLKRQFAKFLGKEWKQLEAEGNYKKELEGLFPQEDLPDEIDQALFIHPDNPGTFIAISRMKNPIEEEPPITTIMRFTP